jgi:uncharacterized protein YcbK (DUF882 family)
LKRLAGGLLAIVTALAGLAALVWVLVVVKRALPDEAGADGSLTAPDFVQRSGGKPDSTGFTIADTLLGRSRSLRFAALTAVEAHDLPGFRAVFGDSALMKPSTLTLEVAGRSFSLFLMRPFAHKRGEHVGPYRLGWWPAERWMMADNYLNPDGFIEVTPANASTPLSARFRMADFLTRDQQSVWPKFVLIEERLIDKLELVLSELEARGIPAGRVVVLSGFRAPYYNDLRIDEGAARGSRHQFGDAADIIIDADGDGRMDDLNRDRRVDLRDLNAIGAAVAAVELRYPELKGGLGTYAAMGPSGPFAHIDVRGTSARWERARSKQPDSVRTPN